MIIVTSGARYIDIDAYACSVAYAELLRLGGEQAAAASTAVWNESITPALRSLQMPFMTHYAPQHDDRYIVVDISDPSQFDRIVDIARVAEVIDHHPGFETYWSTKTAVKSRIEFIGAAATLIYESWQNAGKFARMSTASAELLAAAILDNTLNFGANVTTERDKAAYGFLARHASLDSVWVARYFSQCQESILADLPGALYNDTKFLRFDGLDGELCVGQLVVWDAERVIADELQTIAATLGGMRTPWLANVVSISNGRSYFLAQQTGVQKWLHRLLGVEFAGPLATADRLWLRKEIMKAAQPPVS